MNDKMNDKKASDITTTDLLNIGAWVSFVFAWVWAADFAIVGAILGFMYYRKTKKKASMIANLIALGIQFIIGFFIGLMWSTF